MKHIGCVTIICMLLSLQGCAYTLGYALGSAVHSAPGLIRQV